MRGMGFAFVALLAYCELGWAAERPNIVLVVADDLGYGDLSCYGAPDIRTPVLDDLARSGIRFSRFYSNGPECTPTRAALMTGRYQHRVGGLECAIGVHNVGRYDDAIRLAEQGELGLPVEEGSLPLMLREAGYVCGQFGKWHLGYEPHFRPRQHGFERTFGVLGGNADYFRHTESDGWNVLYEDDQLTMRAGYLTDLITDEAIKWYQSVRNGSRPFFLYLPYTAPHSPIQGPGDDTGVLVPEDKWGRGPRTTFAAMVERMDQQIGRLLAAIARDGLSQQTLVIFMSDNGADANGRNSPYSGNKGTTHEGGIRVPCIVRWPKRLPEGRVVDHTAVTMDFTASLVRIGGASPPADRPFDGIDILQQIQTDQPARPRTLFWRGRRGDRTWKAVCDGSMKRIWRIDGEREQTWLFDLEHDPRELHDLSQDRPEEAERLARLMAQWEQEVTPRR